MTSQDKTDYTDFMFCEGDELMKKKIQGYGIYEYMKFCENKIRFSSMGKPKKNKKKKFSEQ